MENYPGKMELVTLILSTTAQDLSLGSNFDINSTISLPDINNCDCSFDKIQNVGP